MNNLNGEDRRMKTHWETRKIITIIVLFLLILAAGVLPMIGGTRIFGVNNPPDGQPLQYLGDLPEDGFTPPQNGDFQPGQMNGNPPDGMGQDLPDGNMQPLQGMGRGRQNDAQMKLKILSQYALAGMVLLFGLLGIIGIWFDKKWAKFTAIIASAAALIPAVISLFSVRESLSIVEAVIKITLSMCVIGLILFTARKTVFFVEDIS